MNKFFIQLRNDYPEFNFKLGKRFVFRAPRTIFLCEQGENLELLALHEVSHAILGHRDFRTDVQRLRMEAEAWGKARQLACFYQIPVDEELIQEELDTYRDWLFKKSRCKKCGLTRFQTSDGIYHCPKCDDCF